MSEVSDQGLNLLYYSVNKAKTLFPNFRLVVMFNGSENYYNKLRNALSIEVIKQNPEWAPILPTKGMWKICPPRLDINCHELIVDNDIVFLKRLKEIDQFLLSDRPLVAEDKIRYYGKLDHIHWDKNLNSGLIGLPPKFDFSKEIINLYKSLNNPVLDYPEEQALLTRVLLNYDPIIVTQNSLKELNSQDNYEFGYPAYHFVESNRKFHKAAETFLKILNNII